MDKVEEIRRIRLALVDLFFENPGVTVNEVIEVVEGVLYE